MMFNNKFNSDNTIHFEVEEWSCTDPDENQFCRKVSDSEFEYIQLKNDDLCKFVNSFHLNNKHLLSVLNDKTKITDWYQDEIDVNDYDADQIEREVAPYGSEDFLGGSHGADRNQLICECIFENNLIMGDYD